MTGESRCVACHAPAPCPTRDLCSDSEACSWPLSEGPTLPRGVALQRTINQHAAKREALQLARDKNDNLTPEADRTLQKRLKAEAAARLEARRTA
jgi:hypothetical protein